MFVRKTKTKKLRSILESPFKVCWPEKSKEELIPIQTALTELLPAARLEESNIKINMLKQKEANGKSHIKMKNKNTCRNFLAPGYQSVIRGMEKKDICCAVFSNDVTPTLLLKVALTCAQTSSIPVIIVPDLKTITSSALGFATMALGFKTAVAEFSNNPFHKIFKLINENPTIIQPPLTTKPQGSILKVNKTDKGVTKHELSNMYQVNTENMYLFRKPNGKRAFVPKYKTERGHDDNMKTEIQNPYDFISLGESTQEERSSHTLKSVDKEKYLHDDDDDTNSDDESIFFVDNIPDESLFKSNYVNANSQEKNIKLKKNKKTNKVYKNVQDLRNSGSQFLHMSAPKSSSYSKDMKKHCKKTNNLKPNQTSSNAVNFQPMSIKTVTFRPNKTKVKKKKRLNVNKNK